MRLGIARVAVALALPAAIGAQVACPGQEVAPYFGWKSTECRDCMFRGAYIEYYAAPTIRDIEARGPADGRLRDNDVVIAVDSLAIDTPAAWRRLSATRPGDTVRFTVRRGRDTTSTSIVAGGRCVQRVGGRRAG